jgi:LURP-one-related
MKQKLWAWGDDFVIKDEAGQDRFFVDGKALSLGDKLSFQDMKGNELAFIQQKLLAWGPTYEIHDGGDPLQPLHAGIVPRSKTTPIPRGVRVLSAAFTDSSPRSLATSDGHAAGS